MTRRLIAITICASLLLCIFGGQTTTQANVPKDREHFLNLASVVRILRTARSSGYTFEELQSLSFRDNHTTFVAINVKEMFDFLQQEQITDTLLDGIKIEAVDGTVDLLEVLTKLKAQLAEKNNQEEEKKYYISRDILSDLQSQETDDLLRLRDSAPPYF